MKKTTIAIGAIIAAVFFKGVKNGEKQYAELLKKRDNGELEDHQN